MRSFVVDCWNHIMDAEINPLRNIPDLNVRHMIMQVLAFMWSAVFSITIADSIMAFGISAIAHVLLIAAVVITVGTFKLAEHKPVRSMEKTMGIAPDVVECITSIEIKMVMPKVSLDPMIPGGEHE